MMKIGNKKEKKKKIGNGMVTGGRKIIIFIFSHCRPPHVWLKIFIIENKCMSFNYVGGVCNFILIWE
ncbi:uncharacterized protein DS421_14g484210 [Arachis hypogaea]|nr:uncharacterized protein DS421_14g484210 [Arachis hypogaea]